MSRGKNAFENLYCQKAIWFLESEIELLKLTFQRTEQSLHCNPEPSKSKVYFIPKPDGLGIIGVGEIATALQLTGEFIDENGDISALIHISEALEQAFNYTHNGIYKSKSTVFRRKTYNRTKALDYLKNLIIREKRNLDKQKMKKDDFIDG